MSFLENWIQEDDAYNEALKSGYDPELEKIVFPNYWYSVSFAKNIPGANLVLYINRELDFFYHILSLKGWIDGIIKSGVNQHNLITALNNSNLCLADRAELIILKGY